MEDHYRIHSARRANSSHRLRHGGQLLTALLLIVLLAAPVGAITPCFQGNETTDCWQPEQGSSGGVTVRYLLPGRGVLAYDSKIVSMTILSGGRMATDGMEFRPTASSGVFAIYDRGIYRVTANLTTAPGVEALTRYIVARGGLPIGATSAQTGVFFNGFAGWIRRDDFARQRCNDDTAKLFGLYAALIGAMAACTPLCVATAGFAATACQACIANVVGLASKVAEQIRAQERSCNAF